MITFPFEVPYDELEANVDEYVSAVFSCLESEFLVLPKGSGFIEYAVFEAGYEALKKSTRQFTAITPENLQAATVEVPIALIVLRTILGFTPPEWAYVATQRTRVEITQGFIRSLDRRVRLEPLRPLPTSGVGVGRLKALIQAAAQLLLEGAPALDDGKIHRLDKADTKTGLESLKAIAELGAPYAMLLYERFLGRPFAGHRDSISELIGDSMENLIESVLSAAGISYRKTKRAERLPGFDQAPDFIVPSEFNPQIVIEAKITEDDGTARDKITRVQHLGELSLAGQQVDEPKYEVVACIGGRGFGVRREDMKKLLYATRGKVFTVKTMDRLIDCTRLKEFRSQ
jgi:hypothetical protein